jgi:hypothetical protein
VTKAQKIRTKKMCEGNNWRISGGYIYNRVNVNIMKTAGLGYLVGVSPSRDGHRRGFAKQLAKHCNEF